MMKKVLASVAVLVLAIVVVVISIPSSRDYVTKGPKVLTALAAKLSCSALWVSGFDEAQALSDNVSYDPLFAYASFDIDYDRRRVTTSLLGLSPTTAYFRDGYGCTFDMGGRELPSNALVLSDSTEEWPLGNGFSNIDGELQALADAIVEEDNQQGLNTRALVVVKDGKLVAQSYAQQASASTPLLGWSMAKTLTATLVGVAQYEGLLAIDDQPRIPAWRDERAHISVQHLLQMTSGLKFDEQYQPGDDSTEMLFLAADAVGVATHQPLQQTPGSHFSYSSGTTNILAALYQNSVYGGLNADMRHIEESLYRPLGIQHAVFETDPSGSFVGSSYWYASAPDWARLGLLWLNGGEINGNRVLSQDFINEAVMPNSSTNEPCYGYQVWLNDGCDQLRWVDVPNDAYAMQGNRQQFVMVIPSLDTVVVRLGWTAGGYPTNQRVSQIIDIVN